MKSVKKGSKIAAIAAAPESTNKKQFPVVAIGASAGGLEAFEGLFSHVTPKMGMAYIVITHLDRNHESVMTNLIQKFTTVPVLTITDGVCIEPNTIYVIPPRKNVMIKDRILTLVDQIEPHYRNLPIDMFFKSLALDQEESAAAIVLSGAAKDGSLGARDIKLHGGLVIAQDPITANFDSMPQHVISTGFVDFILSPEQIPEQLIKWSNYGDVKDGKISLELQQIFNLVRARTGYDFSSYKLNTICRRIEKQMDVHHISLLKDYVVLLREDPLEVDKIFKNFLIGVTQFFRDPEAFATLKTDILPTLLNRKPLDYCVRIWVPGCSSGEEVYSIAILIAEYMEEKKLHYYVQIFGTDIDTDALAKARSGVYSEIIAADVSPERLKRFFIKDKNNYKIKKEIRSMVVFGEQNLIKDPPFTRVDFISCRNLLIYLNLKLQKKVLPLFHYSLKPKGVLFLGMSESISGFTDLFEFSNRKTKFFERKDAINSQRGIISYTDSFGKKDILFRAVTEKSPNSNLELNHILIKFLINKFVPSSILVDEKGCVLYINGNVDKFISSMQLVENVCILDIAHPNIKSLLKSAISTTVAKKKQVVFQNLAIKNKDSVCAINLRVLPLTELSDMLLIVFEEIKSNSLSELNVLNEVSPKEKNKIISNLERELQYTKENLQATIEEQESSNEELQSMNEELQSTNEEIETSKEELHSLNEELVIMNTELQNRIDQLATVNDDMTNLFNSTNIATIFLDNNLCIKRFTPKAQEFVHLIPTDIGRSMGHFSTNIKYDKLMEDAAEVLKTLNQKNIEVESKLGNWFLVRILPYRTTLNMIDGVVITLTDITDHKESEKNLNKLNIALHNALNCSKKIIDTVTMPLLVLTTDLKVISANRAFYKSFYLLPEDVIEKFIYNINGLNISQLREILEQEFPDDNLFEGFEIDNVFNISGYTKIKMNARKIFNHSFDLNYPDIILIALEPK